MNWQLAQLNIARMKAPLDDPAMQGFTDGLDAMNSLAESSEGFVWRLQGEGGNATQLSPFEDPLILVNMSVWQNIDSLKSYAYKGNHKEFIKSRRNWFGELGDVHQVLWWVPSGTQPSETEAKSRLEMLRNRGTSPWGFLFKSSVEAPQCEGITELTLSQHAELLKHSGLNTEDFSLLSTQELLHARHCEQLLAGIAIQELEGHGLLRSLVVAEEVRGAGLARDLVALAVDRSKKRGLESLFLLTQSASQYFERLGFRHHDRRSVPPGIARSSQFSELCPDDSDCLMLKL